MISMARIRAQPVLILMVPACLCLAAPAAASASTVSRRGFSRRSTAKRNRDVPGGRSA
jgi:hypothetical protein